MTKAHKPSSKSPGENKREKTNSTEAIRKPVHKKIAPDEDDDMELELNEREVNIASRALDMEDDDDDF